MYSKQRQQKKDARYKKKGPGNTAIQNKEHEKREENVHEGREKDTSSLLNVTSASSSATKEEVKEDVSVPDRDKYSKRKVESNANRYREIVDDEYDVESDEQLQARLIQLINIPVSNLTMPMSEEQDYTYEQCESFTLALDCNALSRALANLSVNKKLDLELDEVELGDPADGGQETQGNRPLSFLSLSEVMMKKLKPEFQFQFPAATRTEPPLTKQAPQLTHTVEENRLMQSNAGCGSDSVMNHTLTTTYSAVPNIPRCGMVDRSTSELDIELDALLA